MATPTITPSLHEPHVQISLDLTSIDEALHVAAIALAAGVDWLEAGTPLILAEGLRGVRASPPSLSWPTSRPWTAATWRSR